MESPPLHSSRRTSPCVLTLLAASLFLAQSTSAQTAPSTPVSDASAPPAPQPAKTAPSVETSVSVGAMGYLAATRIQSTSTALTTESLSPSAGVFATFRQTFKPWLGYSVNVGYTQPTYRDTVTPLARPGTIVTGIVTDNLYKTNAYEISLSYIAHKNLTQRLSVFGEAGVGTLGFAVINKGTGLPRRSNAFRPTGIAGVGVDYRLPHGFGARAQYRGLFLNYPYPDDDNSTHLTTLFSQPTLSLTYTFGNRSHR